MTLYKAQYKLAINCKELKLTVKPMASAVFSCGFQRRAWRALAHSLAMRNWHIYIYAHIYTYIMYVSAYTDPCILCIRVHTVYINIDANKKA